jgi:hypothetical protein
LSLAEMKLPAVGDKSCLLNPVAKPALDFCADGIRFHSLKPIRFSESQWLAVFARFATKNERRSVVAIDGDIRPSHRCLRSPMLRHGPQVDFEKPAHTVPTHRGNRFPTLFFFSKERAIRGSSAFGSVNFNVDHHVDPGPRTKSSRPSLSEINPFPFPQPECAMAQWAHADGIGYESRNMPFPLR